MKQAARCALILLLLVLTPMCHASEATNPPPPPTLKELAESYKHVFLGTVENKTVGPAHTHYTLNVTKWIKGNTGNHTYQWTTYGGSEIACSPTTSLWFNTEYIILFDTSNSTHILSTPNFKLRGNYSGSDIDGLRFDLAIGDYPHVITILVPLNETNEPKPTPEEIAEVAKIAEEVVKAANAAKECLQFLDTENETINIIECPPDIDQNSSFSQCAFEAARRAAAIEAATVGVEAVSEFCITPGPISGQDQLDDFAPYFLSICLLSLALLDRLTNR